VLLGAPVFWQHESFKMIIPVLGFLAVLCWALAPPSAITTVRFLIVIWGLGLWPQ
jgi:hypothetical protein